MLLDIWELGPAGFLAQTLRDRGFGAVDPAGSYSYYVRRAFLLHWWCFGTPLGSRTATGLIPDPKSWDDFLEWATGHGFLRSVGSGLTWVHETFMVWLRRSEDLDSASMRAWLRGEDDFDIQYMNPYSGRLFAATDIGAAGDTAGAVTELSQLLSEQLTTASRYDRYVLATRSHLLYWRYRAGDPASGILTDLEDLLNDQLGILGPDSQWTQGSRDSLAQLRAACPDTKA
jgi:hypothetical protein